MLVYKVGERAAPLKCLTMISKLVIHILGACKYHILGVAT